MLPTEGRLFLPLVCACTVRRSEEFFGEPVQLRECFDSSLYGKVGPTKRVHLDREGQ